MDPGKDILNDVKRFKKASDNLKAIAHTRTTDIFIEADDDYHKLETDEARETLKKEAFNEWMGFWLMSAWRKHGMDC